MKKKEAIHNLREKYGNLHNKIEYRMDILGPWTWKELWEHQDPIEKLKQWKVVAQEMNSSYPALIEQKQSLCTECEIIMDLKSRNYYYLKHKGLMYNNHLNIKNLKDKEAKITVGNTHENQLELLDNWEYNL